MRFDSLVLLVVALAAAAALVPAARADTESPFSRWEHGGLSTVAFDCDKKLVKRDPLLVGFVYSRLQAPEDKTEQACCQCGLANSAGDAIGRKVRTFMRGTFVPSGRASGYEFAEQKAIIKGQNGQTVSKPRCWTEVNDLNSGRGMTVREVLDVWNVPFNATFTVGTSGQAEEGDAGFCHCYIEAD